MTQAAQSVREGDPVWRSIRKDTRLAVEREAVLASFLHATILKHDSLEAALSFHLAQKLDSLTMPAILMREVIEEALAAEPRIGHAIRCDLQAIHERDSACPDCATPFLFFKGFHALQVHRIAQRDSPMIRPLSIGRTLAPPKS